MPRGATATILDASAPGDSARTRLEWARTLVSRNGPGDIQRARGLLGQALATAAELGLGTVERRSRALLEEARG